MEEQNNTENQSSIIQKIFNCCFRNNYEIFDINKEETDEEEKSIKDASIIHRAKKELENEFLFFPVGMIREEERNKIHFTKSGLINFIINLQNLNYENICNENNIIISKRNSSDINEKFPIIRCEITRNKSYFKKIPKIQQIIDAVIKPELRKKWDNNLKEYKIIEKINNNSEIIKIITNRLSDNIEEKEFYDKRTEIINDGVYYLFSSSIPDNNNFISLDYDKGKNYLNIMVVMEDREKFYFDCLNQFDINVDLNDNIIGTNLPNKVKDFFGKYFEFLNTL